MLKVENRNSKREMQNSKIAVRSVTPAKAGVHQSVDSRLRENDA
jgi:hypothetical protein